MSIPDFTACQESSVPQRAMGLSGCRLCESATSFGYQVYATVKPCLKTLFAEDLPTARTNFDITIPRRQRQCFKIGKSFLLATNDSRLSCVADGPKCHKYASASKCMTVVKKTTIPDTVLYANVKSSEQMNDYTM
ncbi:hypothetical protein SARC_04072 [Sphaeroforma arctica JP610]|uniref:Uncharacterized protein n=1 Tax=Sphaeroforma arctica JP610 TaxID=667725 RepID=A0A0L0G481_9EUKA|nr:hypothetical protein SARC_04072 [Sphaeroforma arctica JP610]KNC83674.1 hypothetical protein SARC_04072 [Sphaeroforma arctica JP610]|eukprot:XP_014157576.1 hypothetical protein SARC_04072 [Sphaeroforma arctica JP610]